MSQADQPSQIQREPFECGRPRVMRTLCTSTHGPIAVGSVAVLRVGGTVALHLGTPQGRYVFHFRERSFVKHARALTDDQGNPWRTFDEIEAERLRVENGEPADAQENLARFVGAAEAAEQQPQTPNAKPQTQPAPRKRRMSSEAEQTYLAGYFAWRDAGCVATLKRIALERGLPYDAWKQWIQRRRAQCEQAYAAAHPRPPIRKPSGALL